MNACLQAKMIQMPECHFWCPLMYLPRNFNVAVSTTWGERRICSDYRCTIYSSSTTTLTVIKALNCHLSIMYWLQSFAPTKTFLSLQFCFDFTFKNIFKAFVSSYCSIFPLSSVLTFMNRWKIAILLHRRIQKTQSILTWLLVRIKLLCCPFWVTFPHFVTFSRKYRNILFNNFSLRDIIVAWGFSFFQLF